MGVSISGFLELKKLLFVTTIIYFIPFSYANAQNLVPNGGFEEVINCPVTADGLHFDCAYWFKSIIFPGKPWYENPSPDWFHTCGTNDIITPPNVLYGFQDPHQGEGYSGLITYGSLPDTSREIMGVELIEPLEIGSIYDITFFLVRAFTENNSSIKLASNNIGIKFTNMSIYPTIGVLVNDFAHAKIDSIVLDTLNWLPIHFNFIADSSYTHLHIGNFYSEVMTDHTDWEFFSMAYYFIDDVSVVLNNAMSLNKDQTAFKITLCPNPAVDYISICELGKNYSHLHVEIFDINGRKLQENEFDDANSFRINVSSIARGLYIFKISANNMSFYEKVLLT